MGRKILYRAISKLNPNERQLIGRIYLGKNRINMTECANLMGIRSDGLWKRIERIRKKLKGIFEELDK